MVVGCYCLPLSDTSSGILILGCRIQATCVIVEMKEEKAIHSLLNACMYNLRAHVTNYGEEDIMLHLPVMQSPDDSLELDDDIGRRGTV